MTTDHIKMLQATVDKSRATIHDDGTVSVGKPQHKWHKEIKAWADGAEIEACSTNIWFETDYPEWHSGDHQFRIKQQPKEKKYLYVINNWGSLRLSETKKLQLNEFCIGKIEVQDD